jgi:hypothetical protein
VDPDPDWIRNQWLWIRIRIRIGNPDPEARNFSEKMHFLVNLKKKFTTKKVLNSTNYFLKNFDE